MTKSDEELVREALRRVAGIGNQSEKARRLGVNESNVRRWLKNEIATPLRGTREPLERFLATHDEEGRPITNSVREREPPYKIRERPEQELFRLLVRRVGEDRVWGLLRKHGLVAAAYLLAAEEDWGPDQMAPVHELRDEMRGTDR